MLIRQSAQSVGLEMVDSKSIKVTLKQAFWYTMALISLLFYWLTLCHLPLTFLYFSLVKTIQMDLIKLRQHHETLNQAYIFKQ